jgi:hypothetical protein
MQLMLLLRH